MYKQPINQTKGVRHMKYYTVEEARIPLMMGRTSIYKELNAGRLIAKKIGTNTVFTQDAIDTYLKNLPEYVPTKKK